MAVLPFTGDLLIDTAAAKHHRAVVGVEHVFIGLQPIAALAIKGHWAMCGVERLFARGADVFDQRHEFGRNIGEVDPGDLQVDCGDDLVGETGKFFEVRSLYRGGAKRFRSELCGDEIVAGQSGLQLEITGDEGIDILGFEDVAMCGGDGGHSHEAEEGGSDGFDSVLHVRILVFLLIKFLLEGEAEFLDGAVKHGHDEDCNDREEHTAKGWDRHGHHDVGAAANRGKHRQEGQDGR